MKLLILILAAVLALSFYVVDKVVKDNEKWDRFKAEHQCKVTAKIDGGVMNSLSVDAKGSVFNTLTVTPDKTGWTCNNGVTYYK